MVNEDVVKDIDLNRRYEEEWQQIYHIRLSNNTIVNSKPMDEFEWALVIANSEYYKIPSSNNNYEVADEMEVRSSKIYRDIYANADRHERQILQQGNLYTTKYMLDYRNKGGK